MRRDVEAVDDVESLDGEEGVAGERETRVIVEVVEDLDASVIGELPVREVALPHLIGEIGFEASE